MGVIKRQSILSSIYAYSGIVIGFITTAILLPKYLDTDQNGLLKLLVSYSVIFGQMSTLGFNHVTVRMFPYFRNKTNRHNGYLFFLLITGLIGFAAFLAVFYLMKPWLIETNLEKSKLFVEYLSYIIPLTFFTLYFSLLDAFYRSQYQATKGSFLKEVIQRFFVLASICLFIFGLIDFKAFVIAYCFSISFPTALITYQIIRDGHFTYSWKFKSILKERNREITAVGFYGLITGFGALAIVNIDSIMVNHISGMSMTGIYAITSYFGVIVSIPSRGFLRIGATVIAQSFKDKDMNTISDVYKRSCLNQMIVGLLLLLGIWVNIENILSILPEDYAQGKYVILFMGISHLFVMMGGASGIIISNSSFYKFNAFATVLLLLLTIFTNWIFIPIYGIAGAALASALSVLLFTLLKFLIVNIKFGFQPYDFKYLYLLLLGVLVIFIVNLLPRIDNLILNIGWLSGITTLLFLGPVLYFRMSEDINLMLEKFLSLFKNLVR